MTHLTALMFVLAAALTPVISAAQPSYFIEPRVTPGLAGVYVVYSPGIGMKYTLLRGETKENAVAIATLPTGWTEPGTGEPKFATYIDRTAEAGKTYVYSIQAQSSDLPATTLTRPAGLGALVYFRDFRTDELVVSPVNGAASVDRRIPADGMGANFSSSPNFPRYKYGQEFTVGAGKVYGYSRYLDWVKPGVTYIARLTITLANVSDTGASLGLAIGYKMPEKLIDANTLKANENKTIEVPLQASPSPGNGTFSLTVRGGRSGGLTVRVARIEVFEQPQPVQ
jgi:hypothetical protein